MGLPSMNRMGLTYRDRLVRTPGLQAPLAFWPSSYWFFNNVVTPSGCIGAYQPLGALSYASSKINLASPGVSDASEVNSGCSWDATGWQFNSSTGGQLTILSLQPGYSVIVRLADAVPNDDGMVIGQTNAAGGNRTGIYPRKSSSDAITWIKNSSSVTVAPGVTSGILCIAATKAYRNGIDEGITLSASTNNRRLCIGGTTYGSDANILSKWTGSVQAIALYNYTLTAAEVAALTTAMNAL